MPRKRLVLYLLLAVVVFVAVYLFRGMRPEEDVTSSVSPTQDRPDGARALAAEGVQDSRPEDQHPSLDPQLAALAKKGNPSGGNLEIEVVEHETSAPVGEASVRIFQRGGNALVSEGRTDQNGKALFGLRRGSYELVVDQGDYALFQHPAIRATNEKQTYVARLVWGVHVSGTVTTQEGTPIEGTVLAIQGATSRIRLTSDSDGFFTVRLAPGSYDVIEPNPYRAPRKLKRIEVSLGKPLELELVIGSSR